MTSFRRLLFSLVFLSMALPVLTAIPALAQSSTALVGATALRPDGTAIEDAVIVMTDGRITAIGPASDVDVPDGAQTVLAEGDYVIPGLIDGHVHFFQSGGLYTRPDAIDLRAHRPYTEELSAIKARLDDTFRRYLRSGVTGVVDVGGPMWNLDVRAHADTTAHAPDVVVAGPLISSVSREKLDEGDPPILKIETPEAARAEVQRQIEAGVDLVKIWYIANSEESIEAFRPVAEATIDEAHAADVRVAVHATQLETARAAVEMGADILVHSVFNAPVDEAFVELLLENEVIYTPTIMVSERYRETFAQQLDFTTFEHRVGQKDVIGSLFDLRTLPDSLVPSGIRQRIQQAPVVASDTVAIRNLGRLHEAGVTIAAGTDAGNIGTPHGPALSREVQLMAEAGLSPMEILKTATLGGAALMGRDDVGDLREGMKANLVVLTADPRENVGNLFRIAQVVKGNTFFNVDAILNEPVTAPVQQQLNAYNARDLGGFLDAYTDDVRIYAFPDSLAGEGLTNMRQRYGNLFDAAPLLHADVPTRIVQGRTVIDKEYVRGIPNNAGVLEATAIYTVTPDGKISAIRFVR